MKQEMNKKLDNLLIISVYDSGWGYFSIYYKGKVESGRINENEYSRKVGKIMLAEIMEQYSDSYTDDAFSEWIKNRFEDCEEIFFCEDGNIIKIK